MVARHGPALLRVANQFSLCHDDALDAYQRALEIYLRRLETVDPATEGAWLRVVVKHEAMAIRSARGGLGRARGRRPRRAHGGAARGRGHGRRRRARRALGRGAEGAEARRGAGAAVEGRGAVLRRDRQALRLVLHEGQPLDRRGPQAVPEGVPRDRGGRGVRALRAGARRARGRDGDERPDALDPPAPAPLRGVPGDRAHDALLAHAADRAAGAVRVAVAGALACGCHAVRVQRRWGGSGPPRRRSACAWASVGAGARA